LWKRYGFRSTMKGWLTAAWDQRAAEEDQRR
jgi:hypothetical protein